MDLTGNRKPVRMPSSLSASLLERFVFPEVCDCPVERIDRNEFVRDVGLEYKNKIGCIERALQLAVVRCRVVHHVEIYASLVRRGLHPFEGDVLHFDVDSGFDGSVKKLLMMSLFL